QTPAPSAPAFVLTPEIRRETLKALRSELEARYVEEATAKKISADLTKREAAGEFDKITSGPEFANRINDLMKSMVTDAHLRFRFSEKPLPVRQRPSEPSPDELKRAAEQTRFINSGFEKVERLRGNIGYLKFNFFDSPENVKRPIAAAMEFLSNTDALIIDLRDNGGGDPAGVQLVCSYLFSEKPVHLNSLYFREGNRTVEFWTLPQVDGPRYLNKDVFVLTSKRTGSGAEECSYNLKNLKRATLIGSSTWGGANPGGTVRLSDHFSCFIPVGKAINPYTKTNWEGVGVQPDIDIDPGKALKEAHLRSLKRLIDDAKEPDRKADLQELYREIESGTGSLLLNLAFRIKIVDAPVL
ncbi:MAG TPA: S41 family peptidase, partial [Fimbriimonadaceae bacterium]|nr:S41 family peptidase [Fimbriimonadaceae bacterium]